MITPLDFSPPNDTGTDTLQRYVYQAEIIAPFCLKCALETEIESVITEHFEDVLIEYKDRWEFIQIKTRNQELGPWKTKDALGGIKSLWRSYQAVKNLEGISTSYVLMLEGAVKKGESIDCLMPNSKPLQDNLNPNLVNYVCGELDIQHEEGQLFLKRTIIRDHLSSRQDIAAKNVRLMANQCENVNQFEIEKLYKNLVYLILEAMSAQPMKDEWPHVLVSASNLSPDQKSKIGKKKLTKNALRQFLKVLSKGPNLLLQRLTDLNSTPPTILEQKLLAAGASADVIKDAQMLRANADTRRIEWLTMMDDDARLEDVRNRVQTAANAITQNTETRKDPAIETYYELMNLLLKNPSTFDPNSVFKQDPHFLFGEACAPSR